jgi:hypothetical protein
MHVLVHAKFKEWWAGYAYGPRYFADVLPALTIFLVYGLVPLCRTRAMELVAGALGLYCVAVQAIGAYAADDRWNRDPLPLERHPERVWDWTDLQITRALGNGWHGGDLAAVMVDAFRDPVPAQLAPLTQEDLVSTINARGLPDEVSRGGIASGVVDITNRGTKTWPAFSGEGVISGQYLTFLVARWFSNNQPLPGAGDVVALPLNLAPGEHVELPLGVVAPGTPGDFVLELRVSQAVDRIHGMAGPDALRIPIRVL